MKNKYEIIQKFLYNFIASFALLFLLITIISSVSARDRISSKKAEITYSESNLIRIQKELIASDFNEIIADVNILSDTLDNHENPTLYPSRFLMLEHKENYHAVTYMTLDGTLSTNTVETQTFNLVTGRDATTYFSLLPYLKTLKQNDVFLSNLHFVLNLESMFYEPYMYYATPHQFDNQTTGWIVLHVSLESMFQKFKDLRSSSSGRSFLLSRKGDYFIDHQTMNINNPSAISLATTKSFVWQNITTRSSPFTYSDGIYFFSEVTLEDKINVVDGQVVIQNGFWQIVTFLPYTSSDAYVFDNSQVVSMFSLIKSNPYSYIMTLVYAILYALTMTNHAMFVQKYKRLSQVDTLTHAYNRRHGFELLTEAIDKHQKAPYALTLAFLDVDHLKEVNDEFSHKVGDQMLQHLVNTIHESIDLKTIVSRIGGDEFLIVFSGKSLAQVKDTIDGIKRKCQEHSFGNYPCEFSVGYLEYQDEFGNADNFVKEADTLMYKDKLEKKTVVRNHTRSE